MDFKNIELPTDLMEIIDVMYKKLRIHNPDLTESTFIHRIIDDWLKPYKEQECRTILQRDKYVLRNNLKKLIKYSGKTQQEIANEIGINRTYLGQVVSGKSEPTITVAILLANAVGCPSEKILDLFYLEPTE